MAGPPTDIPASELWAKLSGRKRPYELVDFPQKDANGKPICQVAMRVLTQGEIIIAKAEATRFARKAIKEKFDAVEHVAGYDQVFEDACATELIYLACRDAKNPENVSAFPNAVAVRAQLSSDEMAILVKSYSMVQLRLGPIQAYLSNEEYDAWIERLKVGGTELPLAYLSTEQQIGLIMYMVSLSANSQTDKSSVGSPPETTSLSSNVEEISELPTTD
jgi:hypothetical protein